LGNRSSALLTKSVRRPEPQTGERRSGQGSNPCERGSGRWCGPEGSCLCDVRTRYGGQINKKCCTTWSESWDAGVDGSPPKDAAQPQRKATFDQGKNGTYMLSVGWNCFRRFSAVVSAFCAGAVSVTINSWPYRRCTLAWHAAHRVIKFPLNLPPNGCGTPCGAPQDSTSSHITDTASRPGRICWRRPSYDKGPGREGAALGRIISGRFLTQTFEESLLLFAGQELVVAGDRVEQDLRVAIVQVRARQEVGADHLQAVTSGFDRAQHPRRRFDRLLEHRDLALVDQAGLS